MPLVERERLDHVLEPLVGDDAADGDDQSAARRLAVASLDVRGQVEQERHDGRALDARLRRSAALNFESATTASNAPRKRGSALRPRSHSSASVGL